MRKRSSDTEANSGILFMQGATRSTRHSFPKEGQTPGMLSRWADAQQVCQLWKVSHRPTRLQLRFSSPLDVAQTRLMTSKFSKIFIWQFLGILRLPVKGLITATYSISRFYWKWSTSLKGNFKLLKAGKVPIEANETSKVKLIPTGTH